jgi:hypothetical protein
MLKKQQTAEPQWPMPVILATQEAEIRRIKVQSQPRQKKTVRETLSRKTLFKNRAGGVAQGEGPKFKPQYRQKKKSSKQLCSKLWLSWLSLQPLYQ